MKTRVFVPALAGLALYSSLALAEDPRLETQAEDLQSAPTCFKLEQPANSCALVGKPIVNYVAPAFHVVDLNGAWAGPSNESPYIYFYGDSQYASGYTIAVDMSLLNRPDGFGYMVDATTIAIVFPDDRDYTGTIENGNTIRWSNNTVWTKR